MKVYDLTHTISKDMTVYSKSTKPDIKKVATIDINGYQESLISIYSHNGTHIDAPKHMCNGKGLDEFEISNFIGNAILIDIENKKIVDLEYIKQYEEEIEKSDFIIFRSGWSRYWKSEKYFKNYPILSEETARYISKSNLKGIGVDMISVDSYYSIDYKIHNILLKNNKIIVENLTNLDKISGRFLFSAIPLKYNDSDGSPTRAIAIIN